MAVDFGGYATRFDVKCKDGRYITAEAFKHMDGKRIPLVWQHRHDGPDNILGHAVLSLRNDGIYAECFFNGTKQGLTAKELVEHKDVEALSIYATGIVEKAKRVLHGFINEVSLVLSGANPGALIDYISVRHSDGDVETLDDEAIIYSDLKHEDDEIHHADGATLKDVYETLNDDQKSLVHYMVSQALETDTGTDGETVDHSEKTDDSDVKHDGESESDGMVKKNVFEQNEGTGGKAGTLQHGMITREIGREIIHAAEKRGSLKAALEDYAIQHGIEDISVLFPDARNITQTPEFDKRRTEWVAGVMNGTRKSPFSRVKSIVADLTLDDARAKGYVTGALKKEEFFAVSKRTTTPTTIYKKQKLDRDDIIDITDFNVVVWIKAEMRLMLEEELARAILIGDGRDVADADKIKDPAAAADGAGVRSILNDHMLYAATLTVNVDDANSDYQEVIEAIQRGRKLYKGTGQPTLYTTEDVLTEMLLCKDTLGRRLWRTVEELSAELRVSGIVTVEPMENETDLLGIMVNLQDYNIGADAGGEISFFDDFDIDYNQYKYLLETHVSGALVKIRSALIIKKTAASSDTLATPAAPTFVASTNVVTIPSTTGVVYKNFVSGATLSAGAQSALTSGQKLVVVAYPDTGYYLAHNEYKWTFKYVAA